MIALYRIAVVVGIAAYVWLVYLDWQIAVAILLILWSNNAERDLRPK